MGNADGVHPRRGRQRSRTGEHLAVPLHHRPVRRIVVFLITYLAFVALIGFPAILVEFVIGRRTDRNPVGALRSWVAGRGRTPAGCSSSPASSSCRTTASSRAGSSGTPSSASPRDSRSPIRPRRTRCSGRSRPASTRFCSTPCSCCSSSASSPPASGAASS